MALSVGNSLITNNQYIDLDVLKRVVIEIFSSANPSDNPAGQPTEGIALSSETEDEDGSYYWTHGTGVTLGVTASRLTVACDGTGGRFASVLLNLQPSTTYKLRSKILTTTDLSDSVDGSATTSLLIGPSINNGDNFSVTSNSTVISDTFTTTNSQQQLYLTVRCDTASRKGWFDYLHIWTGQETSVNLANGEVD